MRDSPKSRRRSPRPGARKLPEIAARHALKPPYSIRFGSSRTATAEPGLSMGQPWDSKPERKPLIMLIFIHLVLLSHCPIGLPRVRARAALRAQAFGAGQRDNGTEAGIRSRSRGLDRPALSQTHGTKQSPPRFCFPSGGCGCGRKTCVKPGLFAGLKEECGRALFRPGAVRHQGALEHLFSISRVRETRPGAGAGDGRAERSKAKQWD